MTADRADKLRQGVAYAATIGRMTSRCCKCKKRLTDPVSLSLGIGPDCLAAMPPVMQDLFAQHSQTAA